MHLYVHVPFCSRRCSYCDFSIAVRRVVPVERYVDGIVGELIVRLGGAELDALSTIYLGGGTPSKLGVAGIHDLLSRLRSVPGVRVDDDAELTVEANPEDVTEEAVGGWLAAGVNRLSIGVQSFHSAALEWMHRTHDAAGAGRAVAEARRAGMGNVSIDLIFALPSVLERDWSADLEQALSLAPDHVSLYGLTVEPHTPLGRWTARGEVVEAPEERYADEYLMAHEALVGAGYDHYEVSNFSRPGRASRHNSAYWRRVPYVGLGPSAHSFDGEVRRWNERDYEAWQTRVDAGGDPVGGLEALVAGEVLAERVYLGLRTSNGLELAPRDLPSVNQWRRAGWAEGRREASVLGRSDVPSERIVLTAEGWLRLDRLAADLTAIRSSQ